MQKISRKFGQRMLWNNYYLRCYITTLERTHNWEKNI